MHNEGSLPVKKVAVVDPEIMKTVISGLQRYESSWLPRSKLDIGTETLKIIAPTPNVDLPDLETRGQLMDLVKPLLDHIPMGPNDIYAYVDVSRLRAQTNIKLHLDNIWLHVLSRRFLIPIVTNELVKMGFMTSRGIARAYPLEMGGVYEIDNTVPHAARNASKTDRLHLVVDVIDASAMSFIKDTWMNPVMSPGINWMWGDVTYLAMRRALA